MKYRFMRIMVFFDVPMETKKEVREYSRLHKYLEKDGYIMVQKSVYSKLLLNRSLVDFYKAKLEKQLPSQGIVQVMVITEKQYQDIECLRGKSTSPKLDSDKRLVVL